MVMDSVIFFIQQYHFVAYPVVFAGAIIEGVTTLLIFGALLTRFTFLHFSLVVLAGTLGGVLHDYLFWRLGIRLGRAKRQRYRFFNAERLGNFLSYARPHIGIYIFFSKFLWNFNRLVLVSAGYMGAKRRRLMRASIPASFLWALVFTSLGYVFADQTNLLEQRLSVALPLITGVIMVIVVLNWYVRRLARKYFFTHHD